MASNNIPRTQRGIVVDPSADHRVGVRVQNDKPLPKFAEDQIMVKVKAVALNPSDFKPVVSRVLKPGDSVGSDFSGEIFAIGREANVTVGTSGTERLQVGDAVAGFTRGGFPDDQNGAFQEYVVTLPELVWRLPNDGSVPYEDAAPMGGVASYTAAHSLFYRLKLSKPWEALDVPSQQVLIWGGATSVGIYAIKLAKMSYLTVATTASPHNHEFLKSIGADAVFDYNDPDTPAKIKEWSRNGITRALDTISEHGSTLLAAKAMSDDKPGVIDTVLAVERDVDEQWPHNIKVSLPVYIYNSLNPDKEELFNNLVEWNRYMSNHHAVPRSLKVMPIKKCIGGLDGIGEGLDRLYSGQVSAEKLVYRL